jgi:hypothetical protein
MKKINDNYSLTLNTRFNTTYFISGAVYDKFALYCMSNDGHPGYPDNLMDNYGNGIVKSIMFPFDLQKLFNITGDRVNLNFGHASTGLSAYFTNSRYKTKSVGYLDMGTMYIQGKYNDFRDYTPYCRIVLYLPFIGNVYIEPSLIINKYINITYIVNVYDGTLLANIKTNTVNSDDSSDWVLIKTISQNIGCVLPFGGSNASTISLMSGINLIKSFFTNPISNVGGGAARGGIAGAIGGIAQSVSEIANSFIDIGFVDANLHYITKDNINDGGIVNGFNGKNVIITFYYNCGHIPTNYAKTYGLPAQYTAKLSTLNGFTIVDNPHLEGNDFSLCLDDEKKELEKILTSGFLLDDKT